MTVDRTDSQDLRVLTIIDSLAVGGAERSLAMVRGGQVDLTQFITHTHALEDWETAFHHAEGKIGLKQILRP